MSEQTQTSQPKTDTSDQPKLVVAKRAKPATETVGLRLSEKAAEKVREHITRESLADTTYLYVGVKGGGCSGLQYVLDLRDEVHAPVNDSDEVFSSCGLNIVCDLKSYIVGNLTGTLIDWQESMMGAGFTFNNPNARQTCGCGSSYSA